MSIPYGSTGCDHEMVERVTFGEKNSTMMCVKCGKEEKIMDIGGVTVKEAAKNLMTLSGALDDFRIANPKPMSQPSYKPLRGRKPLPSERKGGSHD